MRLQRRLRRLPSYLRSLVTLADRDALAFIRLWLSVRGSVRGWLRMPDAFFLYRSALRGPGSGAIVEIGSAWGRSTVFLARGSKAAARERVIAIDPHTGDDWYLQSEGLERLDSSQEFRHNMARFEVADWVELMQMTSDEAASRSEQRPIRLLFVDGLHTYEGVASDIATWVPRVVPGGVIVFDDYENDDPGVGVRRAVDELMASGLVEPRLRSVFNLAYVSRSGREDLLP